MNKIKNSNYRLILPIIIEVYISLFIIRSHFTSPSPFFLCFFLSIIVRNWKQHLQNKKNWNLNEGMNDAYIALCVLLYTQSDLKSWGGGGGGSLLNHHQCDLLNHHQCDLLNHHQCDLLNHHQCAASTWMMRRLPQDNGASVLTTHQLQVERRESHRANKLEGDY